MDDKRTKERAPSVGDRRDVYVSKTPPKGSALAAPHEVPESEDFTGKYSGEELASLRARRPTDKRLARLEGWRDEVTEVVTETRIEVKELRGEFRELRGELKTLPDLVEVLRMREQHAAERDHVTFTAQIDVDKAKQTAGVEVAKAKELDVLDAKKTRRNLILTIVGAFTSGGIVFKLLQHLGAF